MMKYNLLMHPQKCTLKNLNKKYQEKWENAYLRVKNARASRALRLALDPGQYWLAMLAKSGENFLGPPLDQILDPLVSNCYPSQLKATPKTLIVSFFNVL